MENITSIPTLWPDRWNAYIPPIFFVRLPFYICSLADLLRSSLTGGEKGGAGRGGAVIISPRFNYVSLQTLSCRSIAQVKICDSSAIVSRE